MKTSVAAVFGQMIAAVLIMTTAAGGREQPSRPWTRMLDLTHTLSSDFPFIPVPGVTFSFSLTPIATLEKDGVAANRWNIHEHIGTQIDAPNHFAAGGKSLEALAVESLIVPLAVIDVRKRAGADADTAVTVDDIVAWERQHGRLPENAAVFMYSGWDARVGDVRAFVNADAAQTMHFPGFSTDAAAFLLKERVVAGIGVDTLSIDPGPDVKFRTHALWLGGGKWAVEAVANLGQVPAVGATVFIGAPKVKGATGGPVRILAVW